MGHVHALRLLISDATQRSAPDTPSSRSRPRPRDTIKMMKDTMGRGKGLGGLGAGIALR